MPLNLSERWLHDRIRDQEVALWPALILHYDVTSGDLWVYFWQVLSCKHGNVRIINNLPRPIWDSLPVHRVTPLELNDYRQSHVFRFPCCLCARTDGIYREAVVYLAAAGRYKGEWLASCATDSCSYLCTSFAEYLTAESKLNRISQYFSNVSSPERTWRLEAFHCEVCH